MRDGFLATNQLSANTTRGTPQSVSESESIFISDGRRKLQANKKLHWTVWMFGISGYLCSKLGHALPVDINIITGISVYIVFTNDKSFSQSESYKTFPKPKILPKNNRE